MCNITEQMERNKHIKKILLLSIALLCTCCKQRVSVGGVILDEKTRKPVAKVYISQKDIFKNANETANPFIENFSEGNTIPETV